ncbi:MAG: hypothetical protein LBG43_03160, partial [Treponema sp.]|nr:hypothetical protein [Treponema sp.]
MPYTHYTIDERNALQAMTGMGLSKDIISVILGKDLSSVYRELSRNSGEGIYTGREAHYEAESRRREALRPVYSGYPIKYTENMEVYMPIAGSIREALGSASLIR